MRFGWREWYESRGSSTVLRGAGVKLPSLLTLLPSENLHLELSLIYSDFTRTQDSVKEYDYMIIRSRNTFQENKYLFFRGIIECNSFRKILTTDFLASFTYFPELFSISDMDPSMKNSIRLKANTDMPAALWRCS